MTDDEIVVVRTLAKACEAAGITVAQMIAMAAGGPVDSESALLDRTRPHTTGVCAEFVPLAVVVPDGKASIGEKSQFHSLTERYQRPTSEGAPVI